MTQQYERPIEEILAERTLEESTATNAEKQALLRDTGIVKQVIELVRYSEGTDFMPPTVHGVLKDGEDVRDVEFDVTPLGLTPRFDAYLRQRPFWTTEELVAYRLRNVRPPVEAEHFELTCDEDANWSLEWLYTENQYTKLFETYAPLAFRHKSKVVRRHGRVTGPQGVALFRRPDYAAFDEKDTTHVDNFT